jgi:hypothetical protein
MSLAELAQRQTAKARDAREETRRRFPEAVAFARIVEERFGPVSLKYASNGTESVGQAPTPGADWFATTPYRRGK